MAKVAAAGARIWLAHYDLSGFLNAAEQSIEQEVIDVNTFADAGPRRLVGNYNHTHSHSGLFDAATGTTTNFDGNMFGLLQVTTGPFPLAHFWTGATEGATVYEGLIELTSEPRSGAIGGAVLLNLEAAGANSIGRGALIRTGTITGTGNGTGYNIGTTTSGQTLSIVFRVFSGTFTSLSLKIQESQNDGGGDAYADVSGLTSGSITTPGWVRATTTAATETWKRVVVSSFTGTNAVIGVTATTMA